MGGLTADLLYRGILPIKSPLSWLVLAKYFERKQVMQFLQNEASVAEENKSLLWRMTIPWMGTYQTQEFCRKLAERAANSDIDVKFKEQAKDEDIRKQGPMLKLRAEDSD